ncbi:MAG TPA: class I SAM-dependent methyltransferase [Candidatus Limnocylindrales bacterium]|nr:class I SAM-dependent methyltransferase [Candidatus Limnocylindrales bacterium]
MTTAYELLDAGGGRRLERFGEYVVDRPSRGSEEAPLDPAAWAGADLRFERYRGWSSASGAVPDAWQVQDGDLRFELRPTPTGQVGLFPEQAPNRAWVQDVIAGLPAPPVVLNLFAYTGAMTLSAVAAGAAVTHVDGARPAVAWARRNVELSGLADRPVRWIVDDVEGFVAREARRGRRYDGLVLDPPSYGHGAGGRTWRLPERLPSLLAAGATLTGPRPAFVVLSAHTPGFGPDRLAAALAAAFRRREADVDAGTLGLRASSGAHLRLGAYARIIGR